jgi:hypothetical protein
LVLGGPGPDVVGKCAGERDHRRTAGAAKSRAVSEYLKAGDESSPFSTTMRDV